MIAAVCPSRQELMDYVVGKLPEDASQSLSSHIEGCPECQASLAVMPEAEDSLVAELRGPIPAEPYLDEAGYDAAMSRAMAVVAHPRRAIELPRPLGEYQLIEELGHGGMGTVYKAMHTKLGRVVAVKVLTLARAHSPEAAARFEREMQAVGRLNDPHIVRAHDAREIDGDPVLVMEYLAGLDLGEILRRLGKLAVSDACELMRPSSHGLASHPRTRATVHRDIKPSNVMLTANDLPSPSGRGAGSEGCLVKILDLGLARLRLETSPYEEMTGSGQGMGTLDYMAPEQASDSREVDIRADIYSLGCTLFKLLTGRVPFSGTGCRTALDKMNAHARQPAPSVRDYVPEVPEAGLAAIVARMLAKSPADRFAAPADIAEALVPWSKGANLADLLLRASSSPPASAGR